MTLWSGAFNDPTDADLRRLNDSISFDRRLYAHDIRGSIAYAQALAVAGVITDAELDDLVRGLEQVLGEFDGDTFDIKSGDEDIHTAVERRLTEIVGAVGGKLHTGRSRNDQVATDIRLWTLNSIEGVREQIAAIQRAITTKASEHLDTLMPGYTHLQPAQPITAAHWLMSFFWMFARDSDRLRYAIESAGASMPLGSGALAGTPLQIDRESLAETLGFAAPSQNSLDSVSDRDFVAEALFSLALTGVHLSRFAEDVILFSNPAFGFITLDDRYSTGSSLMPQKRNPDPLELARGKTGRLIGGLSGLLTTLKGLPSGYNKDVQEDKIALFDAVDTMHTLLPVITAVIRTLRLNADKMRAALDENMLATDLADYLVAQGLPFRDAHHAAGRAVRMAAQNGVSLSALTLEELQSISPLFSEDVRAVFDFGASVVRRANIGGTAPSAVREQIAAAQSWLDENE